MTSLPSQAVLAAGSHAPSVVTPANAATVPTSNMLYSYDAAYLQRMLDYSAAVDPSAVGKSLHISIHSYGSVTLYLIMHRTNGLYWTVG